ncbi:MAG: DUF6174 domain-containing protein [Gammaproteobacteria bacterium]|nr:DUF6174 domain-containing protein [Gammaproteobacteria bacterium]
MCALMPKANLIGLACFVLLCCSSEQQDQGKTPQNAAPAAIPAYERGSPAAEPGPPPANVAVAGKTIQPSTTPDACRYDGLSDALTEARARWQGTGINSYSMTIQRSSFNQLAAWPNSKPLKLRVRDGQATGNLPRVDAAWLQTVTVDGLFEYIENQASQRPDCLSVKFDPMFGYPISIRIDPVLGGADDEVEFAISDFGP